LRLLFNEGLGGLSPTRILIAVQTLLDH
jgi:hypothetical protein